MAFSLRFRCFKTSKARDISVEWTYVVTGGEWGIAGVEEQVKLVRGWFYMNVARVLGGNNTNVVWHGGWQGSAAAPAAGDWSGMIVRIKAYNVLGNPDSGEKTFSFRLMDVSVKHSDTLICEGKTKAYPLKTDISLKLRLWSCGQDILDPDKKLIEMPELCDVSKLTREWY